MITIVDVTGDLSVRGLRDVLQQFGVEEDVEIKVPALDISQRGNKTISTYFMDELMAFCRGIEEGYGENIIVVFAFKNKAKKLAQKSLETIILPVSFWYKTITIRHDGTTEMMNDGKPIFLAFGKIMSNPSILLREGRLI